MSAIIRVPGSAAGDGHSLPATAAPPAIVTAAPPATLRIGVVGAGRVGAVLGAALAAAGHRVINISAGSDASRARAARLLPGVRLCAIEAVPVDVDFVLLTVPDDVLSSVVARLAAAPGQVVAHTSGAHGIDVLAPLAALGAWPIALHPAMTFTGTPHDLGRLAAGVSFGVTAPDGARPFAERLVADLGGIVEWISAEQRVMYHAALAHGANHLTTLVNEAADRLRDAGVRQPDRVLAPLLRAALDNALASGDAALTGPVVRGDTGTVAAHLATLLARVPESVPAYVALARRTADRALAAGLLRPEGAEPLLEVLADAREGRP